MSTKKIFLKQYFDTFIVSDSVMKESLLQMDILEGVIQQSIDEIRTTYLQVLSDMDKMTPDVYRFITKNFYVDIEKTRDVRYLENVIHIRPYILVDEKFYNDYYKFLSNFFK